MIVMMSVLESALTVSPDAMSTETTVPLIGLFSVASLSDCSALMRSASAVSMAAWSDAICSGVSVLAPSSPNRRVRRSPTGGARCRCARGQVASVAGAGVAGEAGRVERAWVPGSDVEPAPSSADVAAA